MMRKHCVGLSPGCENGVGPELMLKALMSEQLRKTNFFWCGDRASLELAAFRARQHVEFLEPGLARLEHQTSLSFIKHPLLNTDILVRQAWFLKQAVRLGILGHIDAVVTGPIQKAALKHMDLDYLPGQTEYFAKKWPLPGHEPLMVFMGGPFIMSLMTTHVPLKKVADILSIEVITNHLQAIASLCAPLIKKSKNDVKLHMLGLNPHAGEEGLLGKEEQEIIMPAIKKSQALGLKVTGPLPADGYFAYFHEQASTSKPDVLVAMYHDQGLIPYKLLSQGASVNVTLGLAIPRTSPAHGTAEALTGTGLASPLSTINAITTALKLAKLNNFKA